MANAAVRVQIYASTADGALADEIALALHKRGCEIVNGEFDPATSDAVVVLWSATSASSQKLIEAARAPLAAGALVPVSIGRTPPPKGFNHLAPMELAGWTGDDADPRWRFVLDEIDRVARDRPPLDAPRDETGDLGAEPTASDAHEIEFEERTPRAPPPQFAPSAAASPRFRLSPAAIFGFTLLGAVVFGGIVALLADREPGAAVPPAVVAERAPPPTAPAAESPAAGVIAPEEAPPTEKEAAEAPAGDAAEEAPDAIAALIAEHERADADAAADSEPPADAQEGAAAPRAAGSAFRDCDACPEMTVIAAGQFTFGSPPSERSRQPSEGPVVEVTIGKAFALATRETTFEEWDRCVADGGCNGHKAPDSGWGRGKQPVVNIAWSDAQNYVRWLSEKTGHAYRLPSEEEWEYAARAGAGTPFSFGVTLSPTQANFDGSLPYGAKRGANRRRPSPVASFEANAFGLYDMHGNVWEWTADCWAPSHQGAPTDGAAKAGNCASRVLKGGAWNTGGWRLRAGHRIGKNANAREFDNGFRVARELD